MRLAGIFKGETLIDLDLDDAFLDDVEQGLGGSLQGLPLGDVGENRRPCGEE